MSCFTFREQRSFNFMAEVTLPSDFGAQENKICLPLLRNTMAPHSSTLALENPMGRGAWWAAVHGVARSWTRLSNFTFTFHFHALEKDMATHSSVLAWRIPGTGEPCGLPIYGVPQSRTQLKRLSSCSSSSSSSSAISRMAKCDCPQILTAMQPGQSC